MKTKTFIGVLFILISFSCERDQYLGHHLDESEHDKLKDHHNNYHVKETFKVIKKNKEDKEKNKEEAEEKRLAKNKMLVELGKIMKNEHKKKQLEFDYY